MVLWFEAVIRRLFIARCELAAQVTHCLKNEASGEVVYWSQYKSGKAYNITVTGQKYHCVIAAGSERSDMRFTELYVPQRSGCNKPDRPGLELDNCLINAPYMS